MEASTRLTINPTEFADSSAGKRILLTAIGYASCFKKGTVVELCTETTEDTRILRYISDVSHYPTVRDYLDEPKLWTSSESVCDTPMRLEIRLRSGCPLTGRNGNTT